MFKILTILTALVLAAGTASGLLVGVANAAAPGDALYGLDRGVESLQLRLASSTESSQELLAQFALERLEEVQVLAERGDKQLLEQALQELGEALLESTGASQAPQATPEVELEDEDADLDDSWDGEDGEDDGDADGDGFKQPKQCPYCIETTEKDHPAGVKLAETFGVSYEEIMGWFCQGYGFGEIKLAYTIAGTGAATVEEIFIERGNGKGWGNIMKDYNLKGKDKPPKIKTNNGQGKEKANNGKSPDKVKKDKKPKKP